MRGEHSRLASPAVYSAGSSPHARGAPLHLGHARVVVGIIPACAGSTSCTRSAGCWRWDHPRMRGEHGHGRRVSVRYWGSSPHARGARVVALLSLVEGGIIPACAGSTVEGKGLPRLDRDHPRMRGEHRPWRSSRRSETGSSPHARGALRRRLWHWWRYGIIPACAGSTRTHLGSGGSWRDHPRMRGEHPGDAGIVGSYRGSSPHARGARSRKDPRHVLAGIIPACAGSTQVPHHALARDGDHPRMRGEHTS